MIQPATLKFLKGLEKNNNKKWFDNNRPAYESAKDDFIQFTQKLITDISKFDNKIAAANLEAVKCISRINRDIRFSKDKTPYKTNFFAIINQGGRKSNFACYYLQLEPANSFIGGGVYMPPAPDLQKIRQEIDYEFSEWKKIIEDKSFKKTFAKGIQSPETLIRPPKDFKPTHPGIEYLKMKGYYTTSTLTNEELQSESGIKKILQNFKTAKPLIDFLNRALEN